MKLQESAEMYLETILILSHRGPCVRSIDIAAELDYKRPSVSVAMKKLRENGYLETDGEGCITLTGKGRSVAETICERHTGLSRLGVDRAVAAEDACRSMSSAPGALRRFKKQVECAQA